MGDFLSFTDASASRAGAVRTTPTSPADVAAPDLLENERRLIPGTARAPRGYVRRNGRPTRGLFIDVGATGSEQTGRRSAAVGRDRKKRSIRNQQEDQRNKDAISRPASENVGQDKRDSSCMTVQAH